MFKLNKFLIVLLLFTLTFSAVDAQHPPFYSNILKFKSQDSINFPPKNAILLIGSSSFTKWTDVQDYFPDFTIINRGFGGSSLPDLIRYADDIIFPYSPHQIIIYCGENDFAASESVSVDLVFNRFKQLFQLIRQRLPNTTVAFISMKPSPSRKKDRQKQAACNSLIKNYLKKQKNTSFIDVYHKMLNEDKTPIKEIFTRDSLHMDANGYKIWQKVIEPYLIK
ncbi:MAG: GDSL-type esterase/lipase family protein [Ginsengibacter sp.]